MITGPLLIVIFVFSLALLLVTIIKFKLNAFVSLNYYIFYYSYTGQDAYGRYYCSCG